MIRFLFPLLALILGPLSAEPSATEITTPVPWQNPLPLGFPDAGTFRLEALTPEGAPVEIVVDRKGADGVWEAKGTNHNLGGGVAAFVDLKVAKSDVWRVRPAALVDGPVTLRLTRMDFATLKESLKQGLISNPGAGGPLRMRFQLPGGTGGPGLVVTVLSGGTLAGAWLTEDGAEAWDLGTGQRLGAKFRTTGAPWTTLAWASDGSPTLIFTSQDGTEAKEWTGAAWVVQPVPVNHGTATALGSFRTETTDGIQVYRAGSTGWEDLELPREPWADRALLGSTEDGLYVMTGASTSGNRAFYVWRPSLGWVALGVDQAGGPPQTGLWALTAGAGSLFFAESRDKILTLRQFDGNDWRAPMDLSAMAPGGAVSLALVPPSEWSRTGTMVIAAGGRVGVYDLP